jgi:hypothetical protein
MPSAAVVDVAVVVEPYAFAVADAVVDFVAQ